MGLSIAKSPSGAQHIVQLRLVVPEEDWSGTFDTIEVERSRGLSTGPFEPLTAATWAPARVPAIGGDQPSTPVTGATVDVVGDKLELLINEFYTIAVTFTNPGPGVLTLAQAATQITDTLALWGRAWVDVDGLLVIETYEPGTGATLRVLPGDAAARLGLPTEEPFSLAFGKASRIQLMPGVEEYEFTDLRGQNSYFYRMRFFSAGLSVASPYSYPQPVSAGGGLEAQHLIVGQARLVGSDGAGLFGVQVRVLLPAKLQEVAGAVVTGREQSAVSDEEGYVSFTLVRGTRVTVSVDGTDLVREITVPGAPEKEIFNLLDPGLSPDDYFTVRYPEIEYAQRRTL